MKTPRPPSRQLSAREPQGSREERRVAAERPRGVLETILVPVDFSPCSRKALQYAVLFARRFRARLRFLHVLPRPHAAGWEFEAAGYDPQAAAVWRTQAEHQLWDLIRETVPAPLVAGVEVRQGAPALEIVHTAKATGTDLIIMATHGHTGRVHAFIGSVAADVTRLAPCPVLVVRELERDFLAAPVSPAEVFAGPARAAARSGL